MSFAEQALYLTDKEFWSITLFAAVVASCGFYFAFRFLRRARIIEDTPTASVRSAHQGYVELAGSAAQMADESIHAPLTGQPCCWYSYKVERRGDKGWFTVDSGTSDHPFLLRDATGACVIDPEGADITSDRKDIWQGNSTITPTHVSNRPLSGWRLLVRLGQTINSTEAIGSRHRYTETRIHQGDQLYAIGLFRTLDEVDHIQQRSEITRELLRAWKKDESSLLFEFDRNRDGHIDPQEWEQVRHKAEEQARTEHQQRIEGRVLNTLSATRSGSHPFLLSTMPQFGLVRRYRRFAILAVIAFFSGGAVAVWMLTLKLAN